MTETMKTSETEMRAFLNHAICRKPDQNRMKNKKVTDVYIVDNWKELRLCDATKP